MLRKEGVTVYSHTYEVCKVYKGKTLERGRKKEESLYYRFLPRTHTHAPSHSGRNAHVPYMRDTIPAVIACLTLYEGWKQHMHSSLRRVML